MTALANIQDFGYNPDRQVQFGTPTDPSPQTGQLGAESAINAGLNGTISALDAGQERGVSSLVNSYRGARDLDTALTGQAIGASNQGFNDAAGALSGFASGGAGAQNMQAALSGALGPIEQERAIASFSSSPGQQYLMENSERAIRRNAAMTGGLQGGNVLKELQRNAIGLSAQDFQNNFNRLGTVADRGFNASSQMAGYNAGRGTNAANLLSGSSGRQMDARLGAGTQIAGMQNNAGVNAANAITGASQFLGGTRLDTGNRIAGSINQTTQQVAGNQSADALVNLLGGQSSQLANLITQAQSGDAASMEALAELFANMSVGAGSNAASRSALPGVDQDQGMIGGISQAAGGIGTLLAMFSDERLKENIKPAGTFGKHNLYRWDWNEEGQRLTGQKSGSGVMAQEAMKVDPLAVGKMDGYLYVNYGRIFNG